MEFNRETALALLHQHVKNEKMIFHSLASEAVMRGLARKLGRDEEKWGLAGLLHDLDVEVTNAEAAVHGTQTEVLLKDYPVDEDILDAIRMVDPEIRFYQASSSEMFGRVSFGRPVPP